MFRLGTLYALPFFLLVCPSLYTIVRRILHGVCFYYPQPIWPAAGRGLGVCIATLECRKDDVLCRAMSGGLDR